MIKFRWSAYHKRIVSYTIGKVGLVETYTGHDLYWSAEYMTKTLTDNRRNPYLYIPYNG
jgi:hypothetical protein